MNPAESVLWQKYRQLEFAVCRSTFPNGLYIHGNSGGIDPFNVKLTLIDSEEIPSSRGMMRNDRLSTTGVARIRSD
jgi:hypothetical protein